MANLFIKNCGKWAFIVTCLIKPQEKIEEMNKNMNIGSCIPEIKKEDIVELSKTAEKEANPLYPVPKLFTAKDLEQVYLEIAE